MLGRDLLIYISIKKCGDFDATLSAIQNREYIKEEENIIKETLEKITCKTITILDEEYPEYLKSFYKPPLVLYYYGDISLIQKREENIAIIGSRHCDQLGINITNSMSIKLCKKYNIVSGMAIGVDSIAANSAILNNGKTIAVLGSGINICYPKSNLDLYNTIKENHLLISEYPENVEPLPQNFIMRNRLIAYFSKALLITEAKMRSGTSTTCGFALNIGEDVMCVPALPNTDSLCNHLIKEGALLVETAEDVLENLKE